MIGFKMLREPFSIENIEWRIQSAGKKDGKLWAICMAYLTARAVMDRLDDVCGPENWKNEYDKGPCGGVMCGISIWDGQKWVTKWDGTDDAKEKSDNAQHVDGVKSGFTGAMKRAGVQWGIGRYLYNLPLSFARITPNGKRKQPGKPGQYDSFRWDPPDLPVWALPKKNNGGSATRSQEISAAITTFRGFDIAAGTLEYYLKKPVQEWESCDLNLLRKRAAEILKEPHDERKTKAAEIFM